MADANYSIAIDAAFSDDSAIPQLDNLTSALVEAGKKSDAYASAVRRLSSDLDTARAASAAANAELARGNDRYSELERDALRAAKAVESASAKGRLSDGLVQQAINARGALEKYAAELKPLEENASRAAAAQRKLEAQLGAINRVANQAEQRNALLNQRFEKMGQAVQLLPGPLRVVASRALQAARANQGLTSVLGSGAATTALVVVGLAAVAAGVAYVTVKLIEGAVAFARYATVTADAQRSAALSREAFAALAPETAAAAEAFDRITAATGQSQTELVALTRQLRDAKVSAADMPAALRAAALAEAALGKGGAAEFVAQIRDGTLAVGAFAAQAQSKFGPIVARQMVGLTAQSERFSRLWDSLFSGLNLDPVLNGIDRLISDLERGEPIAEFLRAAFGGLFGVVSDNAESAAVAIEAFALQVAIWMTRAYIVARDNLEGIKTALDLTAAVFDFATGDVVGGVRHMRDAIERETPGLAAAGASAGGSVVMGMIEALTGNPLGLLNVVSGLMGSVLRTAKSTLGIASPSKEMAAIADDTVAGYANRLDDRVGDAQGSMAALVDPSSAESSGGMANLAVPGPAVTAAPAQAAAGGAAGGAKVDLSGATFHLYGLKDAEHAAEKIGEALTAILRGDVQSLRGAPA